LKFAKLISTISYFIGRGERLDRYTIKEIEELVQPGPLLSDSPKCDVNMLHSLLESMQQNRKIDAIKAHRALTGYALKESKDIVERYWQVKPEGASFSTITGVG
jgi:hypothetical protein